MNFIKLIFLFLTLLFSNQCFGQDTLKNQKRNFIIKFSPGLLLGDYITTSIGIPLGIEMKINKNLSFDQNFSYITSTGNTGGLFIIDVNKIKGIRSDSELKCYLNKRDDLTGYYFATHFLYQYTDATEADYANNLKVFRNLIAIHEKFGWQSISKKGFVFDVAIGLGTRYTYSKSNNSAAVQSNEFIPFYWYRKTYEFGDKWFFSINYSFKVGYAF